MTDADCKDFFISYTRADTSWAEWIAWVLEASDYTVNIQKWDCLPGNDFGHYMHTAITSAARTIAVMSDAYLTSEYCEQEWLAGWHQDVDGADRKLIAIRVEECARPGLLGRRVTFDLFDLSEEQATARLLEDVANAVSGRAKPTSKPGFPGARRPRSAAPRFPGTPPSTYRVRPSDPNFTGRDDELTEMKTCLNADSGVTVYSVSGLGGVGKTALATAYAHRFANDYDVVWWIDAETHEAIPDYFAALATDLGVKPTDRPDELRVAVYNALRTAGGWLLIFDNAESVDDIASWLPSGPVFPGAPGHVIVTTRCKGFRALGKECVLSVIDMDAAVRLLQTRVPDLDHDIAVSIAAELGCLPLALTLAACYLDETQIPPDEYLDLLTTRDTPPLSEGVGHDRGKSLERVWELSLDKIRDGSPAARQILDICAYFAAEHIPLDLFTDHHDELPEPLDTVAADTVLFHGALAKIFAYSMAERDRSGLQLHRLVQVAVRMRHPELPATSGKRSDYLPGAAPDTTAEPSLSPAAPEHPLTTAVAVLSAAAPADTDDPQHWPRWAQLLPHVLATVGRVTPTLDADVVKKAFVLQDRAHRYVQIRLEDITAEDSQNWVRAHNERTLSELGGDEFERMRTEALEILDTDSRIPYVRWRGEFLYNFWRDAANPRGLWRRTTLQSYRSDNPDWDVLIDVDALADIDGENWVWAGAEVLEPDLTLALISLSRGGADATVVREFDMTTKQFVVNGFELLEAKSDVSWQGTESVLVGTYFGPDSLTDSGYPRIVKRWHRGQPLSEATTLFAGEPSDVNVGANYDPTPGFERLFIVRHFDFFNRECYELRGEELVHIDVPTDAVTSTHREWLLVRPRTPWTTGGQTYPAGSLLAANYDEFISGTTELNVVFDPDEHSSLESYAWTRDRLILVTLLDVASHVEIVTPGTWERRPVDGLPANTTTVLVDADEYGDEIFLDSSGFDTPSQLLWGHVGDELASIKSAPGFFDASDINVAQHFVASDDGTMIPYFVVGHRDSTGPGPTLLGGYGGFENSMLPGYSGILGRLWLSRGGTYVLANIRGGGEYGPTWHLGAIRENRHKVYEDFAAVARDLVVRGITTVGQLGAQGGSNGGLLMGVMLTRYPELFGALVCSVPLLDMRRFHLLLAGASWKKEYGDPDDPDDWAFMAPYSPYHNISADANYPALLMTTSTRDDRVHPGHARKMTAALEAAGHRVRYYENIEGGHAGAADNAQAALKSALAYAFLWRVLGKTVRPDSAH